MQSLGASKVSLSSVTSEALWTKSGRFNANGKGHPEIYRLRDARGNGQTGFLLSPTHEEEITEIVANAVKSYKQLPLRLYQTTRKYRNELRPRQGLLRAREFIMKDLYTFDVDNETALQTYSEVKQAYANFFGELKIPYLAAEADSGNMGGSLSHEFHFASKLGEDTVFSCSDCDYIANQERAAPRIDDFERGLKYCRMPWIGVADGGRDLVLAFYPTVEARVGMARSLNWQALKRAVPGVMADVADPLIMWQTWKPSEDDETPKSTEPEERRIFIVSDYRVNPDTLPEDIATVMDVLELGWGTSPPSGVSDKPEYRVTDPASGQPINLCSVIAGDDCPRCDDGRLRSQQAVELGHTFYLGTRYSEPLDAAVAINPEDTRFESNKGQTVPVEMGCHGIGVSRLIGAAAAILADDKGLNWPRAIAPFEVVIVSAAGLEKEALGLYDMLKAHNVDAIVDDRNLTLPWKLNDADLIGYPVIAVISKRTWSKDKSVELQSRRNQGYKKDHSTIKEDVPHIVNSLLDWL